MRIAWCCEVEILRRTFDANRLQVDTRVSSELSTSSRLKVLTIRSEDRSSVCLSTDDFRLNLFFRTGGTTWRRWHACTYVDGSLLWPRYARTRRHAEAELRINNSCYKAFRYGDIDYVHRLCGPKVSEDDDDVNAVRGGAGRRGCWCNVATWHDENYDYTRRTRATNNRQVAFWTLDDLDGDGRKSVAFIPPRIKTHQLVHVYVCTSNAWACASMCNEIKSL